MKRIFPTILSFAMVLNIFLFSNNLVHIKAADVNLTVTSVKTTASTVYDAEKLTLFATIRNTGSEVAKGNISVTFYINGKKIQTTVYHKSISAGGLAVVSNSVKTDIMFGIHKLTAVVNETEAFPETDYSDNRLKERIAVIDDISPNPPQDVPVAQKNPVTEDRTIRVEAENCKYLGTTKTAFANKPYSGTGYAVVDIGAKNGLVVTCDVSEDANYNIYLHLANGTEYRQTFTFEKGGSSKINSCGAQYRWESWDTWSFMRNISFKKGQNTFTIYSNDANQNEVFIDYIEIKRVSGNQINSFKFKKANNPSLYEDIACSINENRITAFVSQETDITNLVADFSASSGITVKVAGKEQQSGVTANNFQNGQYYDCYKGDELVRTFTVVLKRVENSNLPSVYLDITPDNSSYLNTLLNGVKADKDVDVPINVNIVANTGTYLFAGDSNFADVINQTAQMHIRGNSTAGFEKKSYKVKFETKQTVLDMDKSKHWVLLANYDDKSLMRQFIGFELARKVYGEKYYTPKMRYVNMYLEGTYMGVYLIGQDVRASSGRINIDEMTATDTNITGGYILERDSRHDELPELMFETSSVNGKHPFTIKEPDEKVITPEMKEYIKGYMEVFLDSLSHAETKEYRKYIDVESFVDWYLIGEIMKVNDWSGTGSIMLHKAKDGVLYMGPVWDFLPGSGVGSGDRTLPTGLHLKNALWFKHMFKDPEFEELVIAKYKEIRPTLNVDILINDLEKYLTVPQKDNYLRWGNLGTKAWGDMAVYHSYPEYANEVREWMKARLAFLDEQWLTEE